jgi:hypothetical protein
MPDSAALVIEIKDSAPGGGAAPGPSPAFTPFRAPAGGPGPSAPSGMWYTPAPAPSVLPTPAAGGLPGVSNVSAFDKPVPVVIVGPRPLPVVGWGGVGGGRASHRDAANEPDPVRDRLRRLTRGFQYAGEVAQAGGQAAGQVARNDYLGAGMTAVNTAANGIAMLGPVGMAASAGIKAATAAVGAFREAVNSFVERAKELRGYDAKINAAVAQADIKRLQADIQEAEKLSEGMSRMVEAQADLEVTIREFLLPIKQFVVEVLGDVMKLLADALKLFLGKKDDAAAGKINAIMNDLLGLADRLPVGGPRFRDPAKDAAGRKLGIPILDV